MALGNNTKLITTGTLRDVDSNMTNDVITNDVTDVHGTAFSFGKGPIGDDSIENFGRSDTILNFQKIFDGNNDGIIDFGPNGILDISRTSKAKAGADQITLQGLTSNQLRYLGAKDGGDGMTKHVYADASVRTEAFAHANDIVGGHTGVEGKVTNDMFDASKGSFAYLYDTALGLNLGGDTIKGFGADDLIITTSAIHNGKFGAYAGKEIVFGDNGVLDLSGETENTKGDAGESAGGQIDVLGYGAKGHGLYLQYSYTADDGDASTHDVTYYYYGANVELNPQHFSSGLSA